MARRTTAGVRRAHPALFAGSDPSRRSNKNHGRSTLPRPVRSVSIALSCFVLFPFCSLILVRIWKRSKADSSSSLVQRLRRPPLVDREVTDAVNGQTRTTPSFDYNTAPIPKQTTLKDPLLMTDESHSRRLVVVVLSARENFDRRAMIRRTWGSNHTVVFAIGGMSFARKDVSVGESSIVDSDQQQVQRRLVDEQDAHQDLLDTIHPDSYQSLPHKLRYTMRWVIQNMHDAQWILKADDDMFVRINLFQQALVDRDALTVSSLPLDPATDAIVIGNIVRNVPIQRGGKWAEHNFVNHGPIYPPWPQGSCGYMVSRAVGNYIAQQYDLDVNFRSKGDTANGLPNEPVLQMYQGEDTSLGIWMEQSNLNVSWINSSLFVNHGDCAVPSLAASSAITAAKDETIAWSIGHRITPEHMLRCYSVLSHAGANVDLDASTVSPKQVFALHSHVSTEPLEPSKDDKAYWSAMDLYQSDQEAKQRSDLLRQRREERAKRRQGLKADK